jgi:hypothetical protein
MSFLRTLCRRAAGLNAEEATGGSMGACATKGEGTTPATEGYADYNHAGGMQQVGEVAAASHAQPDATVAQQAGASSAPQRQAAQEAEASGAEDGRQPLLVQRSSVSMTGMAPPWTISPHSSFGGSTGSGAGMMPISDASVAQAMKTNLIEARASSI